MHSNKRWPVFILSIALILGILQPYPIVSAESEQTYENYDENDKDANVICAKAADELLTISDITASFVIGKLGDKVCISGRSIGDINVQIILEKLGGGGHITLAGAQVEGLSIGEVKNLLIEKINEYFEEQQN